MTTIPINVYIKAVMHNAHHPEPNAQPILEL